jgi:hypothetical protein
VGGGTLIQKFVAARLAPGTLIAVEVVRDARVPLGHLPTIGDLIP